MIKKLDKDKNGTLDKAEAKELLNQILDSFVKATLEAASEEVINKKGGHEKLRAELKKSLRISGFENEFFSGMDDDLNGDVNEEELTQAFIKMFEYTAWGEQAKLNLK